MTKNRNKKILFCTGISRAFRTTSIANLYEIAQFYPVVVLSEELDKETKDIISDKKLFPKLEQIISFKNETGEKRKLFSQNAYFHHLAKEVIGRHKPDIILLATDFCLFDFYLMKFAKRNNAIVAVLNSDLRFWKAKDMSLRTDLTHSYFSLPSFIPLGIKIFLMKIRKFIGYIFYNWILPVSVGEAPLSGKSSRILYTISGLRADYRIAFSKQDYELSLREGVPKEKLLLLEHALNRKDTKKFFDKVFLSNTEKKITNKGKILTLLFPEENYGFNRKTLELILEEDIQQSRINNVKQIADVLNNWRIFIKPHPAVQKYGELKETFEAISPAVRFIDPSEPLDKYIEISDVVVGFPPISSALFTADLQRPEMPVISLDLNPQEILGDCYKNFDGIEYIDNEKRLTHILKAIKKGEYLKPQKYKNLEGFSGTKEVIDYLLEKKSC